MNVKEYVLVPKTVYAVMSRKCEKEEEVVLNTDAKGNEKNSNTENNSNISIKHENNPPKPVEESRSESNIYTHNPSLTSEKSGDKDVISSEISRDIYTNVTVPKRTKSTHKLRKREADRSSEKTQDHVVRDKKDLPKMKIRKHGWIPYR